MKRGRDALARQHYDEAVQALTAALDLLPDDRPTQKALKRARTARVDARLEYGNRINRARTALRGGHFEAAQRLYAEAAHILPGDAEAQRGQNVAEDALQQSQTAFRRFMSEAGEAMAEGDYSQAVRAFREALRLTPDDPAASQGYREAVAALREAPTDPRDYERALQAGREALRQHHYAAATRAFRAALRADPDSTQAQDSLRRARYSQAVAEGQRALRGRRTTDAIAAFEEALQVIPGDPAASAFLEQARALRR